MLKTSAKYLRPKAIAILSMALVACNEQTKSSVTTFTASSPDGRVITKITNINYAKRTTSSVVYDNSAVLNSSSLLVDKDTRESMSDVIFSDRKTGEYGSNLWIFNGKEWIVQTGAPGQPPSAYKVYGKPSAKSVILESKLGSHDISHGAREAIWIYDGESWSKQTGEVNQPYKVEEIYGIPTLSSIVLKASSVPPQTDNESLWVFNGKNWNKLTGGINQPASVSKIASRPNANFIVLLDKHSNLWVYNGHLWRKLSGGNNQPSQVESVYGAHPNINFMLIKDKVHKLWVYNGNSWNKGYGWAKTNADVDYVFDMFQPNFIAVKDSDSSLWVYNGKSWSKQTGGLNQPKNMDNLVGYQYPTSMVLKDSDGNVWVYNGKAWSKQSGGQNQPQSVDRIFGNPTASSIVLRDRAEQNLWVYNGKSWSQQTGLPNQPKAVNVPFMVHQRQLQQ